MTATELIPVTYVSTHGTAPHGLNPDQTSTAKPQMTTRVTQLRCQQTATASPSARSLITAEQTMQATYARTHGTAPHGLNPDQTSTAKPNSITWAIQLRCQQTATASPSAPH